MVPSGSSSEQMLTLGGEDHSDIVANNNLSLNPAPEHPFNALFNGSHVEIRHNAGSDLKYLCRHVS